MGGRGGEGEWVGGRGGEGEWAGGRGGEGEWAGGKGGEGTNKISLEYKTKFEHICMICDWIFTLLIKGIYADLTDRGGYVL